LVTPRTSACTSARRASGAICCCGHWPGCGRSGAGRYRQEDAALQAWLAALEAALPRSGAFALALAGLPQVLKGYGETQRRGREHYARLWREQVVAPLQSDGDLEGAGHALAKSVREALAEPEPRTPAASPSVQPVFWATPGEPR
jgi:indolepyruvate ferredoxin oxidoreductase beta subunit